jgi:hypothetical protein
MKSDSINQALQALADALNQDNDPVALDAPVHFKGKVYNKGMLWSGSGHTKQFVLASEPDRFFSSESIDLAKDCAISVNRIKVLDEKELGPSVIKSNLREVGRLKGLIVDGSLSVNQYLYFDHHTDRLGLGTDQPNAALSVAEDGIEIIIGTEDYTKGVIGTFASHDLELKTDNTTRLKIAAGGNIELGNPNRSPIQATVHGKLAVGVSNPDPNVDLHVRGDIKFGGRVHKYDKQPPQGGVWNEGDIIWNSNPQQKKYVGWVCTKAGNPGIWNPFGEIR